MTTSFWCMNSSSLRPRILAACVVIVGLGIPFGLLAQELPEKPWYSTMATYAEGFLNHAELASNQENGPLKKLISGMGSRLPRVSAQLITRFLWSPASSAVGSLRKQGGAAIVDALSDPAVKVFAMESLGVVHAQLAETLQKNAKQTIQQTGRSVLKYLQAGTGLD